MWKTGLSLASTSPFNLRRLMTLSKFTPIPTAIKMDSNHTESKMGDPAEFDIVATYNDLLRTDPDLSMPVAAIESLLRALASNPTTTVAETLEYLQAQSKRLVAATPNPISLSAGTSLLQRYLAVADASAVGNGADFDAVRAHLLQSGRAIVERAALARTKIAAYHRWLARPGQTVLTTGGSRVVNGLLRAAADAARGNVHFRVVYVLQRPRAGGDGDGDGGSLPEGWPVVAELRRRGVPVAAIPAEAVAHAMRLVDHVLVGAEAIVKTGGAVSRLGTYQIACVAKQLGKPFYVLAEKHKLAAYFPLHQYSLPIAQTVVEFQVDDGSVVRPPENADGMDRGMVMKTVVSKAADAPNWPDDAVDYTVCADALLRDGLTC
jgi:translation initiation factor eIF-2B subunit alpha